MNRQMSRLKQPLRLFVFALLALTSVGVQKAMADTLPPYECPNGCHYHFLAQYQCAGPELAIAGGCGCGSLGAPRSECYDGISPYSNAYWSSARVKCNGSSKWCSCDANGGYCQTDPDDCIYDCGLPY